MKSKKLLTLFAALTLSSFSLHSAQFDVTGLLITTEGIEEVPISVSYDAAGVTEWLEPGWTIATPSHGDLSVLMQLGGIAYSQIDDMDYPAWPGITFHEGQPHALDFVVLDPFQGAWRLGAGGPLMQDRPIGDSVIQGWSVQAFVDTSQGRLGTMAAPVPQSLLAAAVPEPASGAFVGAIGLLLIAAYRRTR